jgi:ribosomal protein S18 acetylase RimI-like enzyme
MKTDEDMVINARGAGPEDEGFLFELYASTRQEEMSGWGWGPEMRESFLKLQFRAQQQHYEMQMADIDHRIILLDGRPVGRILVLRSEGEITLADIALLPEQRGAGIGASLIRELFDEGRKRGLPVRLHVLKSNRALRLYERMGFEVIGDTGMHFHMEWRQDAGGDYNFDREPQAV